MAEQVVHNFHGNNHGDAGSSTSGTNRPDPGARTAPNQKHGGQNTGTMAD
ncbi:hypothetical protein BJX62DRAFT_235164 [Aspergillus germanicus]